MNPIVAAAEKGFRAAALMLGGSGVEPTHRRVIVVRSRINDLAGSAMWQIHACARIAKAELHHGHSWNLQPLAQRVHFRRDVAEIFREEWQAPKSIAQFVKQVVSRTIHPAAMNRG